MQVFYLVFTKKTEKNLCVQKKGVPLHRNSTEMGH